MVFHGGSGLGVLRTEGAFSIFGRLLPFVEGFSSKNGRSRPKLLKRLLQRGFVRPRAIHLTFEVFYFLRYTAVYGLVEDFTLKHDIEGLRVVKVHSLEEWVVCLRQ